jgi:hypothetical protein
MKVTSLIAYSLGAIVTYASSIQAQLDSNYSYHPNTVMSLGAGFSPSDLNAAKLRAIEFTEKPTTTGAAETKFTTLFVTNSSQLNQALGIDLQVEASYLAFKGSASFSYDQSSLFTSDTITVVMRAYTDFGSVGMEKVRLTPAADALITAGKMDQFEATYGSRYVVQEKRGASVAIILSIADVKTDEKTAITASVSGSAGWGPVSGSVKSKFQQSVQRSAQNGSLSIQVVATGGKGFAGLGDLVANLSSRADAIEKIEKALGAYVAQFDSSNAAPIGFFTASMRDFGWDPKRPTVDLWSEAKRDALIDLVERYRRGKVRLSMIKAVIDVGAQGNAIKPEQLASVRVLIPGYEKYLAALADAHKDLLSKDKAPEGFTPPVDPHANIKFADLMPPPSKVAYRVKMGSGKVLSEEDSYSYMNDPGPFIKTEIDNGKGKGKGGPPERLVVVKGGLMVSAAWWVGDEKLSSLEVFPGTEQEFVIPGPKLIALSRKWKEEKRDYGSRCYLVVQDKFGRNIRYDVVEIWPLYMKPPPLAKLSEDGDKKINLLLPVAAGAGVGNLIFLKTRPHLIAGVRSD